MVVRFRGLTHHAPIWRNSLNWSLLFMLSFVKHWGPCEGPHLKIAFWVSQTLRLSMKEERGNNSGLGDWTNEPRRINKNTIPNPLRTKIRESMTRDKWGQDKVSRSSTTLQFQIIKITKEVEVPRNITTPITWIELGYEIKLNQGQAIQSGKSQSKRVITQPYIFQKPRTSALP